MNMNMNMNPEEHVEEEQPQEQQEDRGTLVMMGEAAIAAAGLTSPGGMSGGGVDEEETMEDGKKAGSRRFFPRVKQLVNPEWEHFLSGVLHCVQAHQAHQVIKASGVEDNAWYQVFHAVYGGIAADCCSVPQGKNRYHKFKDKIVELWRYMAVTEPPDHDVGGRLWKMGHTQWEMYKSLLLVAGKNPIDLEVDKPLSAKGKRKARGKAAATIARGIPIMHYEPQVPKKNLLPSPLHELHKVWKLSLKHNDPTEMGYIRNDYHSNIRSYIDECLTGCPDIPAKLMFALEGLSELREIEHEAEIKQLVGDAYKATLQRYLLSLNKKKAASGGRRTII